MKTTKNTRKMPNMTNTKRIRSNTTNGFDQALSVLGISCKPEKQSEKQVA